MNPQQETVFRQRVGRWQTAFSDRTTGIHVTLDELVLSYAAFRTTTRIVFLANQKRETGPPLNAMVFDLISDGYWSSFLLGMRRLLDTGGINGKRGVYSLRSVIDDIEACRVKISRQVYVEIICGARYDLDLLRKEQWDRHQAAGSGKALWVDPDLPHCECSHRHFDGLSGVAEDMRTPEDLIDPAVLVKIKARLTAMEGIADFVSTHIAHSGNEESRHGKSLGDFDIRNARAALKSMKEIADLVGVWFANEGGAGLAMPQGDQFEGLDRPLIASQELIELETQWQDIDRDVASWSITAEQL